MPQIERLARMVRRGERLGCHCLPCNHHWFMSRKEALEAFGADATPFNVRKLARCSKCGQGDCVMNVIGDPQPPDLTKRRDVPPAPFPVEMITFAVCRLAGWDVRGSCATCRVIRALHTATGRHVLSHPDVLIGRAWEDRKLVCRMCRQPFESVDISQRHPSRIIAKWSPDN